LVDLGIFYADFFLEVCLNQAQNINLLARDTFYFFKDSLSFLKPLHASNIPAVNPDYFIAATFDYLRVFKPFLAPFALSTSQSTFLLI